MSEIYAPAEDSYLLAGVTSKYMESIGNKDIKILDMGSATGIQAKTCIDKGIKQENITLVDINPDAVKLLTDKFPMSKVIKSDLFSNFGDSKYKFDLIIFNPPYLPEDSKEPEDSKIATAGGLRGSEIINKFLKQSKNYLTEEGKILLLTSSRTKDIDFNGYNKQIINSKKLFYEELFVWELT